MAYEPVERRHGFLKVRRRVVIGVDPESPTQSAGARAAGRSGERTSPRAGRRALGRTGARISRGPRNRASGVARAGSEAPAGAQHRSGLSDRE